MLLTLLVALGILIAVIVVIVGIGYALPTQHTATHSRSIHQPITAVWAVITDYQNTSVWRKDVHAVVQLPNRNGHEVWKEMDRRGRGIPYETVTEQEPYSIVRQICDEKLPFGGSWHIKLTSKGSNTEVTITENGEVRNPIFRFVSRFIMGHSRSILQYLDALAAYMEPPPTDAPAISRNSPDAL